MGASYSIITPGGSSRIGQRSGQQDDLHTDQMSIIEILGHIFEVALKHLTQAQKWRIHLIGVPRTLESAIVKGEKLCG